MACTLTGIGQEVPFETLHELTRRYPFVEFGVLYSISQAGYGRYPTLAWISQLVRYASTAPELRLALHVCGGSVGALLANTGHVSAVTSAFQRIQLNFRAAFGGISVPLRAERLTEQNLLQNQPVLNP